MEEKVKLDERVKIVGTGKSNFMPQGKEYEVHPLHAKKLVNSGKARYASGQSKFEK